ncbi:MAG: CARDB domain-containing protein [Nitrospirota bacterium]
MMTCKYKIFLIITFLLFPVAALAGNIDPDNDGSQYAWGENVGWINFEPSQGEGVTVTDSAVIGKAWGENVGWINLSPATGGVANDGNGNLSGFAWGENVGWINFAPSNGGVTIDPATGAFSGKAWGENIGWINFAPNGKPLKTSWRPPKPDLVVTSLSAPDTAAPGEEIIITDTTMNNGLGSAPESTTGYYLSTDASLDSGDIFLYSRPVDALDAGTSSVGGNYHVTIPPYPPMGNCFIIAKADWSDSIVEEAENNNTNSKPITIATVAVFELIKPNGGEIIPSQSVYTIQWSPSAQTVTYDLLFSIDAGKKKNWKWEIIAGGVSGASFNWTVPKTKKDLPNCLVKVIGYDSAGNKVAEDVSAATFTIQGTK